MRAQLCSALTARAKNPEMLFLTGDLGFMALEPLQAVMSDRFINAGVAEQNMVTVSAALAKQDFEVWVYSIAPFCYARPFEQLRNDVAFHRLPVKLIGNGGGYGYGVMGPTHHAIEDYGTLLTLPNFSVIVPVFDEDVDAVVTLAASRTTPTYLRLGRGEAPAGFTAPPYAAWRQLTEGDGPLVIAVGPLAGSYIAAFDALPLERRPSLWAASEMPIAASPPPAALAERLSSCSNLIVAEEHVEQGGFAAQLGLYLAELGMGPRHMRSLHARAHTYDGYGSQPYLRVRSGLDAGSVLSAIVGG